MVKKIGVFVLLSSFTLVAVAAGGSSMNEIQTDPKSFDGPDGVTSELMSEGGSKQPGATNGGAAADKTERLKAQLYKDLNADPAADKLGRYLWRQ
ncbi:hypothetical protein PsaNZ64_00610 [Pseudomonas syringae pv. actinidiae]|uniref:hypothetical protein n=1 Tax=Pseudomonas syringae group TaxID=136849 RepID=UPI0006B98AAB|nr:MULTISPECIES: hypothetical protein [Pseudomonas syringae group]OKS78815.1 hypothetical protein PsaNZ64_00610 [Pseudomonas syringae pv. actinidiae]